MTDRTIPKLPALPLLGNLPDFRARRLDLLQRVYQECGEVGIFQVGVWPVVLMNRPADLATVLAEQADAFEKSPLSRRYLRLLFGNGIFVTEDAPHRRHRKLMAPAFQHRQIANYASVMAAHAETMQHHWQDGMEVDLAQEMMRLTLWVAGSTLFTIDLLQAADEIGAVVTDLTRLGSEVANRPIPIPLHWPTPRNRRLRAAIARMDALIYGMIAERRGTDHDPGDVLSMLLHARDDADGSGLSDQEIRDELITLLIAGHETAAMGLTWTWYLLMQHPRVYAQIRAEVDRVLGGRTPTVADVAQLPVTLRVFKEALRLYPPSWLIMRQARRAVTVGAYHLPDGMRVAISPYTLHRNPEHFPDPERFDPDRWTPENEANIPRYAYLPFGAGPHICIGNHFAMLEAQLVLATLVQRVTFELVPGQVIEPEPLITLRPKNGIRAIVRRR